MWPPLNRLSSVRYVEVIRRTVSDTPQFRRGYDVTLDGRLVLPRGLRHAVGRIVGCSRRIVHVETLASLLADRGHQVILVQGGMTAADRHAAVDRLAETNAGDGILVIGAEPFIGEGFDAPVLDTLLLAGSISFDGLLVQCAGRVIRAAPGKDVAEVHGYQDPATPILAVSLQRRMPGYRALASPSRSGFRIFRI